MASAFGEAIMSSMIASMDPQRAMEKDAIASFIQKQNAETLERKSESIDIIAAKLEKAKANNMPPAVTNAYEKLLAQLTA